MLRTGSTRFGYMSKLFALILMVAVMGFYIVPAHAAFAEPGDEEVTVTVEEPAGDEGDADTGEEPAAEAVAEADDDADDDGDVEVFAADAGITAFADDEDLHPGLTLWRGGSATFICPNCNIEQKKANPLDVWMDKDGFCIYFFVTCPGCKFVSQWSGLSNNGASNGWNNVQVGPADIYVPPTDPDPDDPEPPIVYSYIVKYLELETNNTVQPSKKVDDVELDDEVTEDAPEIDGWAYHSSNPDNATIIIGEGTNEIIFYYVKNPTPPEPVFYTVTYNANGGVGADVVDGDLEAGDEYGVRANEGDIDFTRAGYIFKGWNTEADGSGTAYDAEDTIVIEEDVILYAMWEEDIPEEPPVEPVFTSYIVYYYLLGTEIEVADEKIVQGVEVGTSVTEIAINISGYKKVNPTTDTLVMEVEDNVFIFYYTVVTPGGGPTGGDTPPPPTTTLTTPGPGPIVIEPPTTAIGETQPPLAAPAETTILPERPPLASFAAWALLNLILTVVTGLIMVALLATYFVKRKEDEEDEENEEKVKKYLGLRLITIAATIIAVILFILTQDMRLPMIFIDQYTIWHVVITAATVALAVFSMKKYEEEEEIAEQA